MIWSHAKKIILGLSFLSSVTEVPCMTFAWIFQQSLIINGLQIGLSTWLRNTTHPLWTGDEEGPPQTDACSQQNVSHTLT